MDMERQYLQEKLGVSREALELLYKAENSITAMFSDIDKIASFNQLKVMKAFADKRVSEAHFAPTTGYGYDDLGRDTLEEVYAQIFGAQDALVRHSIISGTHALALCLFAVLRPGDTLLSVTGKPYDTLEELIGINSDENTGSLKNFGINYRQVDLKQNGDIDFEGIKKAITPEVKMVFVQKSKGYDWRRSLDMSDIKRLTDEVKKINPNIVCMVDNCYGEFVETAEPTEVGADLMAGSLIKNPGGGLAESGGYIAGRRDLVELAAIRLNVTGKDVGASLGHTKPMLQGLFMAPHTVAQSIKTAVLMARVLELMGYETCPKSDEVRSDIIQSVKFGKEEPVLKFCRGIQSGSPVDSFVTPEPWDMPGYSHKVIMAAGAFTQGASIEISADAPIKPPYVAYMQGGLTYESGRFAVLKTIDELLK